MLSIIAQHDCSASCWMHLPVMCCGAKLTMTIMTMIVVIMIMIMITVPLSRSHRKDSSKAHTETTLFTYAMHNNVGMPPGFAFCRWYDQVQHAGYTSQGRVAKNHVSCRKQQFVACQHDYALHMAPNHNDPCMCVLLSYPFDAFMTAVLLSS